jgi:hypothetical protein
LGIKLGDGQRRRNDDCPADYRAKMDIVDLAQSRERAVDRQTVG